MLLKRAQDLYSNHGRMRIGATGLCRVVRGRLERALGHRFNGRIAPRKLQSLPFGAPRRAITESWGYCGCAIKRHRLWGATLAHIVAKLFLARLSTALSVPRRARPFAIVVGVAALFRLIAGVGFCLALVFCVTRWFIRCAWPQSQGIIRVRGVHGIVRIMRDAYGIPHIYAIDDHDLFFTQGYVHAQDRLWQMDFQRRIGLGRLSEVLGEAALETDKFFRTLGLNRSAQRDIQVANTETLLALDAYAQGVNAYIDSHRRSLPIEYRLLHVYPELWEPLHSLAWAKAMQFELSESWSNDLLHAELVETLGTDRAMQLIPRDFYNGPYTAMQLPMPSVGKPDMDRVTKALHAIELSLGSLSTGLGSNAWVVSPARTTTRRPMLANDPHLRFGVPSVWYEMGLHSPTYSVVGASLPGTIGILIGHNDRIAWGVTNLQADVQDLYMEKLSSEKSDAYEVDGQYVPFTVMREPIYVKGTIEPVTLDIKISRHGPVINGVVDGLDQVITFRWQAAEHPSTLVNAILPLNRARDWQEFTQSLRAWDAPAQNFVYADVDGNIAYHAAGVVPIRANGIGLVPMAGWTNDYEWIGTIPFDELPQVYNPTDGYIVTANNKPVIDQYPYYLGNLWSPPYRASRILAHLTAKSLTLEDMAALQADQLSLLAQKLTPFLLAVKPLDRLIRSAQKELAQWDFRLTPDSAAACIFEVTQWHLLHNLLIDELGVELTNKYLDHGYGSLLLMRLLAEPNGLRTRDGLTDWRLDSDAVISCALEQAVRWLSTRFGDRVQRWAWGELHRATFRHGAFGSVPLLNRVFNIDGGSLGGDGDTVLANSYSFIDPYTAQIGPGYRQIVDVGAWVNSRAITNVGQSGHLFHPHYRDLIPLWREHKYHVMHYDLSAEIAIKLVHDLRLIPQE